LSEIAYSTRCRQIRDRRQIDHRRIVDSDERVLECRIVETDVGLELHPGSGDLRPAAHRAAGHPALARLDLDGVNIEPDAVVDRWDGGKHLLHDRF
jgi:hypothetical protein